MSVLRRAWRVLADPPASDAARAILLGLLLYGLHSIAAAMPFWDVPGPLRPDDALWLYVLLWFVRQRDEARAAARQVERPAEARTQ